MAIDYSGLFGQIGKVVRCMDTYKVQAQTLTADLQDILDAFQADDLDGCVEGLVGTFGRFQADMAGRRQALVQTISNRLTERELLRELRLGDLASVQEVIHWLHRQMLLDSQTIDASTVTITSPAAGAGNEGDGVVILGKTLDGFSSPGRGPAGNFRPHPHYDGLDSELCYNERFLLECTSDSYTDGVTPGTESFRVSAGPSDSYLGVLPAATVGSGDSTIVYCLENNSLLQNLSFEQFSGNAPQQWSIDSGTAGTHIYFSTSTAFRNGKSLRLTGDGVQASIGISQAPSSSALNARRRYCLAAYVRAESGITSGTLTIQFEGTGYTASASERIQIPHSALPTAWTLYHFHINMPRDLPSDLRLVIKWTGTPTSGKSLFIDALAFGPVTWVGGMHLVVISGATPWARNDTFTWEVSNDEAGIFQRAFRDIYGVQLPSDAGGGETIPDSLAE